MKPTRNTLGPEHGGAGVKFLLVFVVLILAANAGFNYVPIAFEGANFKQEMDTAVVKGLATAGKAKPVDVVQNLLKHAMADNNVPNDAVVVVKPTGNVIQAHVSYSKEVQMLPFGLYTYRYDFDHTATPAGYLTKE